MTKKNKPAWHEANMETVKSELEFLDDYGKSDEIPRLELDFGETNTRILPAYSDTGRWYHQYAMHWNLPIPGDQTSFRCAQAQQDPQECLFCEAAEMYRSSSPDLYKRWRAKSRYDFNALNLESPEDGVLLLSLPPTAAEKIFEIADRWGDPTHPENGYNFLITKKKTGPQPYNVEYSVFPDKNSTELEDWSVLEELNLLDEIFPAPSLEAQQKSLQLDTSAGNNDQSLLVGVEEDVLDQSFVEQGPQEEGSLETEAPPVSARELLRERMQNR